MNKHTVSNQPLVSILLPVYNAEGYLRACLDSILAQTYKNFEVIAVNDGSTDNSLKKLRNYAKTDSRIKVFTNKTNRGIGYTANIAMFHSRGQFVARMDADDIMLPNRLKLQINYLQSHPQTVLVGGQCIVIDEEGRITGEKRNPEKHSEIYKMMLTSMSVQNPTIMINRKLARKDSLKLDANLHPVDDLDMLFKLTRDGKFVNLPEYVLQYRVYRASSSMKNPKRSFLLTLKVRVRAVAKYGYKPTFKGVFVCLAQALVVLALPNSAVYALYAHMRGIKRFSLSLPIWAPIQYTKKVALLLLGAQN
ncbi:MAG: glycosyltransferase family 2 protein [Candidatus Blackburnbacteria bacterium]|nr:glycosyltransferase family 2 protein [Candidatus Blackburnbacteria bacterium]